MSKLKFPEQTIFACNGSKCGKHKEVRKALRDSIKEYGLKDEVELIKTDCMDRCKYAPVICLQPENKWFVEVTVSQAENIVKKHLLN